MGRATCDLLEGQGFKEAGPVALRFGVAVVLVAEAC